MTYAPSKEQFEMELFRWKADETPTYYTQNNTYVSVRAVSGKWQDHAKEIAFGLFVGKRFTHKAIPDKLKAIIGHAPTMSATFVWIIEIKARHVPITLPF